MDRRTEYEVIGGHKHAVPERYFDTDDVVQALAAYEDTGLEPEEIKQMCQFCKSLDKKAGIKPVCAADCEWCDQEAGKGEAE